MRIDRYAMLLLALPLAALAQQPACEVIALRGEASAAGKPLAMGDKLTTGAELRTATGGRVRLRCIDGSTLVVGDSSVFRIERFELKPDGRRSAVSVLLDAGLIGQKVAPSPGGTWEVRTPTAVTAVRGTEFIVEVDEDKGTAVNVQSGKVDVEAMQSASGGGTRSLRPRSQVTLDAPKAGTRCHAIGGCRVAEVWSAERVQKTQDRLSFD